MAKDIVEIIADNSKNFESSKLIKENFDRAVQFLIDKQRDCIIDLLIENNFDASDISKVDNDATLSLSGYVVSDLTGDDFVDAQDLSLVDNNAFNSVSSILP